MPGLTTGAAALSSVAARFGFGSAIDFELPTASSQVSGGDGPIDGFADRVELANAAYGQAEVLATPLQMALVAAAIANDGVLMAPDPGRPAGVGVGGRGARGAARDRTGVDASDTATILRDAMVQAVQGRYADHYAGGAKVADVTTAGKSGTAQLGPGQRAAFLVRGLRAGRATTHRDRCRGRARRQRAAQRAVPLAGRLMTAWLKRFATDPTP